VTVITGRTDDRFLRAPDDERAPRSGLGVNAIASWEATTGLVEAARRCVTALLDAGVDVALDDVDVGAPLDPRRLSARLRGLRKGRPFLTDIFFVNVNEMPNVDEEYLRPASSYVIGSWYWELSSLPEWIAHQARRVDEIWVASSYVASAFREYVDVPITVVPAVVRIAPSPEIGRPFFGLDEGLCTFFFSFDAASTLARKNPWAIIEAYRMAFTRRERDRDVRLVMKTINLARHWEAEQRLREEMASVGGRLIDEDVTGVEMASLLALCDVYVSLHRAEGFGLGMAEAMYLAKPVIATNYSGNADFTTPVNSCPVNYRLAPVDEGELRFNPGTESVYEPGILWAEPDIAQAAKWMRYLYDNPAARTRIGRRGQQTITTRYSSPAAGAVMSERLSEIEEARSLGRSTQR
jgi:glycosyltransferase involved in cell wall biosynthesis